MDRGMEPFVIEPQTEEHRAARESLKRKHVDDFDEFETRHMNIPLDMMSTCATDTTEDDEYYVPPTVKKPLLSNDMSLPSADCESAPEISNIFKIPENKGAPRKTVMPKKTTPTVMLPAPSVVFSSPVAPPPAQVVGPAVDPYPRLPVMYALPINYPTYPQTARVPPTQAVIEQEIERNKWKDFLAWENKYNYYGALYTKREEPN